MMNAGMDVIDFMTYFKKYDGQMFKVSPWEGHPNKEGHEIFASCFLPRIENLKVLAGFARKANGAK